jgi:hypothetical protein
VRFILSTYSPQTQTVAASIPVSWPFWMPSEHDSNVSSKDTLNVIADPGADATTMLMPEGRTTPPCGEIVR